VREGRRGVEVPYVLSLLLFPAIVVVGAIVAGLSVPVSKLVRNRRDKAEQQFRQQMTSAGRTVEWMEFIRQLNNSDGTLIVERFSLKGPVRGWWTNDDVYKACPWPLVDWLTMANGTEFDEIRSWFHQRYTSASSGGALLIFGSAEQWRSIRNACSLSSFRDGVRWVEVAPPASRR
jgi:hypothetical protein